MLVAVGRGGCWLVVVAAAVVVLGVKLCRYHLGTLTSRKMNKSHKIHAPKLERKSACGRIMDHGVVGGTLK